MDGHYAFGEQVVFTEADGQLYNVFIYLYVNPVILIERMEKSSRNKKYVKFDIKKWQYFEIESLCEYCHKHNKDFYIVDEPKKGYLAETNILLDFIRRIQQGYSCVNYARTIVEQIKRISSMYVLDGDRTVIYEDSSALLGYKTELFNGNFYTGFQVWRHMIELDRFVKVTKVDDTIFNEIHMNAAVLNKIDSNACILTSGYMSIWEQIAKQLDICVFGGEQMSSDTKYFVTKFLQEKGILVAAFGDSMNDYFMLKQADVAYLVLKKNGMVSSSLDGRDVKEFAYV